MSWNLIIVTEDKSPLGSADDVKRILDSRFPNLDWIDNSECVLPDDNGFRLELGGDPVNDIWTHGGFYHLEQFAAICKENGWIIGDAQTAVELDLDDPYSAYPPEDRP